MASPEVSIVITFFREGELLRETIESALGQTFKDLEIVLVDNNADPVSCAIAKEYSTRFPDSIRYVHEPVQGACSARNRGILESRGGFVAFLDGDDLTDPRRIALQREAFLNSPGVSLVSSWYDRVSMDNQEIVRKDVSQTEPQVWLETQMVMENLFPFGSESGSGRSLNFPLTSTTFFERSTALSVGGFDNRLNPRWFEDIEFYLRMYTKGEFLKVPLSLVRYRISSPDLMEVKRSQMDWVGFCRHMDLFYRILGERFGEDPRFPEVSRKIVALWLRFLSTNFLIYKDGKLFGKKLLERSLRSDPFSVDTWKLWFKACIPQRFYPRLFWFDHLISDPLPKEATTDLVESLFQLKEGFDRT